MECDVFVIFKWNVMFVWFLYMVCCLYEVCVGCDCVCCPNGNVGCNVFVMYLCDVYA